ncbi:MAG TPA: DUF4230 domain-containing protein [Candidatus Saccharimonadales bacterium]|nr:DUF4230 domain-containing protein [Candidatus Saccharimonadales bacterium]
MWKRVALALVALGLIFALGLLVGAVAGRWLPWGRTGMAFNNVTVLKQVQNLSQLVTVKYVLEKVINFEDAKWYGENRVLLVAHGVVKAGIDLDRLQAGDIQISGKTIHITLPRPRIMDVYLDDRQTEILERSTGIMRNFDKDLEQNARREAVEDLRRAASQSGILNDASERARAELTVLLYKVGFTDVDFKSK